MPGSTAPVGADHPPAVPPRHALAACPAAAEATAPARPWAAFCDACPRGAAPPLPPAAGNLPELLRAALRGEAAGLELHYQPIVALAGRGLLGVEALLRWRLPDGRPVNPAAAVALAQAHGLDAALDRWVLDRALRDCAPWLRRRPDLRVSVNVASGLLGKPRAVALVAGLLDGAGLAGRSLRLEVTEVMILDAPAARHLGELQQLGLSVAIDDFGTGRSSLARLLQVQVDEVKLDRSFLAAPCGARYRDLSFLRAVANLAHARGAQVVAEGIEAAEDEALARQAGCDAGQGYWYARALPAAECAALALAPALPWPRGV